MITLSLKTYSVLQAQKLKKVKRRRRKIKKRSKKRRKRNRSESKKRLVMKFEHLNESLPSDELTLNGESQESFQRKVHDSSKLT